MTEEEWLCCEQVQIMLHYLGATRPDCPWRCSSRKWRLFACACCRSLWHLLPDEENRHAVEVVEKFADKRARKQDVTAVHAAANATALDPAYNPVLKAMGLNAPTAALWSAHDAIALVGKYTPERVARNANSRRPRMKKTVFSALFFAASLAIRSTLPLPYRKPSLPGPTAPFPASLRASTMSVGCRRERWTRGDSPSFTTPCLTLVAMTKRC
jgi:hypothetical protein